MYRCLAELGYMFSLVATHRPGHHYHRLYMTNTKYRYLSSFAECKEGMGVV